MLKRNTTTMPDLPIMQYKGYEIRSRRVQEGPKNPNVYLVRFLVVLGDELIFDLGTLSEALKAIDYREVRSTTRKIEVPADVLYFGKMQAAIPTTGEGD